jgi:molybdenum cofactor cytidylyltransferase
MQTAALVLSGGASERFGGSPKALLPTDERSAVRRIADVCAEEGLGPIVVVAGAHAGPVAHEVRDLPVHVVVADDWREGRTASIQAGLRALPEEQDVLFWPVDHPFAARRSVATLLSAPAADPLAVWFIPTHDGHGGHPILWRAAVRPHVMELRSDAPLRALLPEFGPQVLRIPVGDPGVVANVDTPEAYHDAREAWRSAGGD